jgi:hypothetical protein
MPPPHIKRLLVELDRGELRMAEAREQMREASAEYEVQMIKYAALRDAANMKYGEANSPYLHPDDWPEDVEIEERGRFRFVRMPAGEAAVLVLAQQRDPMTLAEILQAIREGGGYAEARSINAALQGKNNVVRIDPEQEGGVATYALARADGDIDPDDLPF